MIKLKRYTNFEALKSDCQSSKEGSIKDNNQPSEFEAFVKRMKRELATKKKSKTDNGKQFS